MNSATGPSGDTVIVWRGGTGGDRIYFQRFDAAGRAFFTHQEWISPWDLGTSNEPHLVAVAANGNFAVAFNFHDGYGVGVFVAIFRRDGFLMVPPTRVNELMIQGDQRVTGLAMNANGEVVVTWAGPTSFTNSFPAIFVKRYQANGVPLTAETLVHGGTSAYDYYDGNDVGIDSAGNYVVTWAYNPSFQGSEIYARRYSATGVELGAPFQVNTATEGAQFFNKIAVNETARS